MSKTIEELKKELETICKEGEAVKERYAKRMADNKTKFDAIFAQIWKIEPRGENNMNPFASTDKITTKAIEAAGLSDDNEITMLFKAHQNDYYSFYKIDKKAMEINFQIAALSLQQKPLSTKADGWQFVSINIVAPKQIHEEIIAPMIEADAKEGKGLFQNVSDIEEESEDEDDLLMVKIYNCEATLTRYWDELKQFGVIGKGRNDAFFKYNFKTLLLTALNESAKFISQNTDKPAQTKNHIASTIKAFDKMPIWGLFFQILTLQGLCQWLESVNINEGDNGFDEAQSLYNWLCEQLGKKEVALCYMPFGDEDKERLKPLCNYLYSTEIGKAVQACLFGDDEESEPQQENKTPMINELTLPSELDTEKARKCFAKAIEVGYMERTNNGYKWLFGDNRGQARLGYFCNKVYSTPRPINKLEQIFEVKKLSASISNADIEAKRTDVKQWRKEIDDKIFEK